MRAKTSIIKKDLDNNPTETKDVAVMRAISVKVGSLMLIGFIAIFYVVYMMGYAQHSEFRVLNGVVHLSLMYVAIRAYYRTNPKNVENYLLGVEQGMQASIIGVVGYAMFIAVFLLIDPRLMNVIKDKSPMGIYLNPYSITLYIFTEGLVVSLIGSYIMTRIYGFTIRAI